MLPEMATAGAVSSRVSPAPTDKLPHRVRVGLARKDRHYQQPAGNYQCWQLPGMANASC